MRAAGMTRRATVWSLLLLPLLAALLAACYSSARIDRTALEREDTRKHRIRIFYASGDVILMPGWTVQYPYVTGEVDELHGVIPSDPVDKHPALKRFNLDEATQMETMPLSIARIAGLSAGSFLGLVAGIALLIAATSCPGVYVVDGSTQVLAGEAYPGAIFRSIQRDDLLALPQFDGETLTIRLRNDNPEVQYTDSASVVVVTHAQSERALSTHNGRAILVGASHAADSAVDLAENDVTPLVNAMDARVWQSDLFAASMAGTRELREGVVATFTNTPQQQAALEITAESTLWMSAIFHQCFAMTGASFGPMMKVANSSDPTAAAAWRDREGVDLRVELWQDGAWRQVASLQTPGVSTLRTMAVPIGRTDGSTLRVRLSGGFGFWRIGTIAIAPVTNDAPELVRVAAHSSAAALVAAKDARFHVLNEPGDSVDMSFPLPERSGEARTLFFASSGYYNPTPPERSLPQLASLRKLQATPGALVTLGLDLYAKHRDQLHEAVQ